MAQDIIVKARGLITQYNSLATSEGALIQADNAVIRRENIIENKRGYAQYTAKSGAVNQVFVYNDKVQALFGTTMYSDNGSGTFTTRSGSYTAPTGYRVRSAETKNNCYFTSTAGPYVMGSTYIRSCGVIAPLAVNVNSWNTGATSTPFGNNTGAAYRATLTRTDENGNKIVSAPSSRDLIINSGASAAPVLYIYIPSSATLTDSSTAVAADYLLKVYRTTITASTGADSFGDECALVYQVTLTSTDLTNGYVSITDQVMTGSEGESLYTNASQEGDAQGNFLPPLARDIALYKSDYLIYANCTQYHRLYVTLLSAAILYNGGAYGKSITIGGVTYTGAAAQNVGANQFQVYNTANTAFNIGETAKHLCDLINRSASNTTIYAYYPSPSDNIGQIYLVARSHSSSGFGFSCNDTTCASAFSPTPSTTPPTSGDLFSKAESQPNYIYYSKQAEPEAVPLLNYFTVGPSNKEILAVRSLRDCLIIISEGGVYRMTGDTPSSFNVTALDLTVICKAVDSIAVVSNTVFMLSNQGVVAITDTGVQIVSHDIDPNILPLLSYSTIGTYAYGIGYESDHQYILSVMTDSTDTYNTQTYVYNIFTQAWTRWTYGISCGVVENNADKLYFARPGYEILYRERKALTIDDYSDPEFTADTTSLSGTSLVLNSASTIKEGDVVSQTISSTTTYITIDTIVQNGNVYTCTLREAVPSDWVTGTANTTVWPSIEMVIQWNDWTSQGLQGKLKRVRELSVLADPIGTNSTLSELTCGFRSETDGTEDEVTIQSDSSGWGYSPWGEFPWGGVTDTWAYRTYIPQRKVYCRTLKIRVTHKQALERCSISGLAITFDPISERTNR